MSVSLRQVTLLFRNHETLLPYGDCELNIDVTAENGDLATINLLNIRFAIDIAMQFMDPAFTHFLRSEFPAPQGLEPKGDDEETDYGSSDEDSGGEQDEQWQDQEHCGSAGRRQGGERGGGSGQGGSQWRDSRGTRRAATSVGDVEGQPPSKKAKVEGAAHE